MMLLRSLVPVLAVCLASCAVDTGDIKAEYTKVARKTGIVPVFPPKEDIQVGDIYFQSFGGPNDVIREFIATDSVVADRAVEHMQSRFVFRETIAVSGAYSDNAPAQTDTYGRSLVRRSDLQIESLPIEALPTVTANAGSAFGFGQRGLFAALGFGFGRQTKVNINFGDVRAYGLPRSELLRTGYDLNERVAKRYIKGNRNQIDQAIEVEVNSALTAGNKIAPWDQRCSDVLLVTRVFLTRKIVYTFTDGRVGAFSASAAAQGVSPPATPNVPPIQISVNNSPGSALGTIDSAALEKSTADLSTSVRGVVPGSSPAGGITFEGYTALGATFSQTYQRPVVVGFEGLPVSQPVRPPPGLSDAEKTRFVEGEKKRCLGLTGALPQQ